MIPWGVFIYTTSTSILAVKSRENLERNQINAAISRNSKNIFGLPFFCLFELMLNIINFTIYKFT